jgi:hypothetical protein
VEITLRQFHALATEVAGKLDAFLKWLNALPGHTYTEVFGPDPDSDPDRHPLGALGLQIGRGKSDWRLYYTHTHFVDPECENVANVNSDQWDPLEEAPLEVRCAALSMLPDLVKRMYAEQSRLIRRLQAANTALDSLAKLRTGKDGA